MKYWKYFACIFFVIILFYFHLKHAKQRDNQINLVNRTSVIDAEIYEWITIVDSNERLTQEAEDVFKRKYSNKTVVITDPHVEAKYLAIYDNADQILIQHFETALKFLKICGHLISSLRIEYSESFILQNNSSKINKFINLYCSETLTQLSLDAHDVNLFTEMTKPFNKVEILFLGGRLKTLTSSTLTFIELFPVIRDLYLQHLNIADKKFLDQEYVHLKYLYVQLCYVLPLPTSLTFVDNGYDNESTRFCSDKTDIERLLKTNPQIETLSLAYSSPKFIETVHKLLPHIIDLTLVSYNPGHIQNEGEPDIIFKYITNFTLLTGVGEVPYNIYFDHLKELHIEATPSTDWFILAERNQKLEKLLMKGGYVNDEQFQRIVGMDCKLVEATLYVGENVFHESIINFLKNSKHLRRVVLISENSNLFNNTLCMEIENEWKITEYMFAIVLERHLD